MSAGKKWKWVVGQFKTLSWYSLTGWRESRVTFVSLIIEQLSNKKHIFIVDIYHDWVATTNQLKYNSTIITEATLFNLSYSENIETKKKKGIQVHMENSTFVF